MNLRRYIPNAGDAVAIVVLIVGLIVVGLTLFVGLFGWPSWVPWSAEQTVPVLERQVEDLTDTAQVATAQSNLDRDTAAATHSTLTIRLQEQARTDEYVRQIEAAPDAASRQRALLEFLCGNPAYAEDPACIPGADPSGLRD